METGSVATGGKFEIRICLSCPAPECKPTSKDTCLLRQTEIDNKKEAYYFIKRHPCTIEQLAKHLCVDMEFARRMMTLLVNSKLIRQNKKTGMWHERR